MLIGSDKTILEQIVILEEILRMNHTLMNILEILDADGIDNCYVTGGAINQTVFNYYHGFDINYGIKDYDIVYYDEDLSYEKEDEVIKRIGSKIDENVAMDIKNQARVHLWYNEKYGANREPYISVEDAIKSFGATVTCIGVRLHKGKMEIFAPYGLNDLFDMIIGPVKKYFTKERYDEKVMRWLDRWPNLKIIHW